MIFLFLFHIIKNNFNLILDLIWNEALDIKKQFSM